MIPRNTCWYNRAHRALWEGLGEERLQERSRSTSAPSVYTKRQGGAVWSPTRRGRSLGWRRDGSWEIAAVKFLFSIFLHFYTSKAWIYRPNFSWKQPLTTWCKFQKKSHSISKVCLFYLHIIPGSHSLLSTSIWPPSSFLAPRQLRAHSPAPSPIHSAYSSQSKLKKLFLITFFCVMPFNGFSLQLE